MPARTRHCEWGASARDCHYPQRGGREGWARAVIHESGDLFRAIASNPFAEEGVKPHVLDRSAVDATRVAGPRGDARGAGAARPRSRGHHGDQGRDARRAARRRRHRRARRRRAEVPLRDGRRHPPDRARRRDPPLGQPRQGLQHQHSRRQRQPGPGPRRRRPGQEPDDGTGRPLRHLTRSDRSHRGDSRARSRRSTAPTRSAASSTSSRRRARARSPRRSRVEAATTTPIPAGAGSAAPTRSWTTRARSPTSSRTDSSRTTAKTRMPSTCASAPRSRGTARPRSPCAGCRTTSACR